MVKRTFDDIVEMIQTGKCPDCGTGRLEFQWVKTVDGEASAKLYVCSNCGKIFNAL